MPRLRRPRNARVPGTTSVISGTPGHYWLNKSGSDLLSHLVGWVPAAIAAAVYHNERDERGLPQPNV